MYIFDPADLFTFSEDLFYNTFIIEVNNSLLKKSLELNTTLM